MFSTRRIVMLLVAAPLFVACGNDDSPSPDTTAARDVAISPDGGNDGASHDGGADAASADAAPSSPQHITPQRAYELIQAGTHTIIDLREPSELPSTGIIAGAKKLPFASGTFASSYASTIPSKDASVILYCASGSRSGQAAQMLDSDGYTLVYDIAGGMTAWKSAGLPTVAP